MLAKVLSWCGSRLGGSAPTTTTDVAMNARRAAVNSLEHGRILVAIDTSRRRGTPVAIGAEAPEGNMLDVARMLAGATRGCQPRHGPPGTPGTPRKRFARFARGRCRRTSVARGAADAD